jgi:hypothetical protein
MSSAWKSFNQLNIGDVIYFSDTNPTSINSIRKILVTGLSRPRGTSQLHIQTQDGWYVLDDSMSNKSHLKIVELKASPKYCLYSIIVCDPDSILSIIKASIINSSNSNVNKINVLLEENIKNLLNLKRCTLDQLNLKEIE